MEYCLYVCLGIGVGSDKKKFFIESDVLRVKLCFSGLGLRALSIVCILFVSCLFSLQSSNYFFFDENSNKFVDFDNIYSIFIIHDWQNHLKSPNILFKLTSNTIFAINGKRPFIELPPGNLSLFRPYVENFAFPRKVVVSFTS